MSKPRFNFDKFIGHILQKEHQTKKVRNKKIEDTPQRRYNKLYQERWQNRMRWQNSEKKN